MNANARYVLLDVIPASYNLLPEAMNSQAATAQLMAIGFHESDGFSVRRQYAGGPARSWWQFETGGISATLKHPASRDLARKIASRYNLTTVEEIHAAVEHNDVLACSFARLLLWTDSRQMPSGPDKFTDGWLIYLTQWNPGKPLPMKWNANFAKGWEASGELKV